jgi:hypothetical protein
LGTAEVLDELLVGSTRMTVPAGSVTHWEGEPETHLELVLRSASRSWRTPWARFGRSSCGSCATCVRDGVVRTERDRIVLLEPARLIQEQGWNQGS